MIVHTLSAKVYSQSGGCHCVEKQEKEQTQDRSKMQAFQTRKCDCYVVTMHGLL